MGSNHTPPPTTATTPPNNSNNPPLTPPFPPSSLPPSTSPNLILTTPSPAERERTCTLTHPKWGPALSRRDYLLRENYLTTVPLARDGGITHWILTVAGLPAGERPILSSCESLRKRAVYCDGGKVVEGVAHGIGSVFTEEGYRGRGYASRMMREVAGRLRGWQAGRGVVGGEGDEDGVARGRVLFSVLYSDIGKSFYAKHGWEPFESCHVAFEPAAGKTEGGGIARPIGYHELAELCAVDERLLRAELSRGGGGRGRKKTRVAVLPELDALLWHLMREDYMTKCIFGKTPTVRGAVAGEPGRRVWAVWMRGYYGGLNKDEGNTLHVLRVVVEDAEQADEELVDGFRSIVQMAQGEAAEWKTQDVQVWNPTAKVRGLMDKCGIEFEVVERDVQSIASLMWYGEGSTDEVEWVANEKYAWC